MARFNQQIISFISAINLNIFWTRLSLPIAFPLYLSLIIFQHSQIVNKNIYTSDSLGVKQMANKRPINALYTAMCDN